MNPEDIKAKILKLVTAKKEGLTARDMIEQLRLRRTERKKIQKWLHEMVVGGELFHGQKGRFVMGPEGDLVAGVIDVFRSGSGVLKNDNGDEVMLITEEDMGTALPGDRVLARTIFDPARQSADKWKRGKVIKIIERCRHDIVGTLRSTGQFLHVVPLDPSYRHNFYVADSKGGKINDRVVVRFAGWQDKHVNPEAEVIEVIGPADSPSLDSIATLRQFKIRDEFPPEVLREAETASVLMETAGARLDLRSKLIVTVDPERAKDFDDALSLEINEKGNRVLGVHIADVSHFVRKGGALDAEALERGNSVYFPDKVVPMLPEQLSNGVCSLKPNEDRLAFSAIMEFDSGGRPLSRRFAKSIIRSGQRLTYEQAFKILKATAGRNRKTLTGKVDQLLAGLNELAQQLRAKRFANYALDLDVPDTEVVLGPEGLIRSIRVVENDISHQMIEECMVAANEAVATELSDKGYPLIHRLHDPPSEKKIEELTGKLVALGYHPGNLMHRKSLADFLRSVRNDPLAYHIKVAILRSMSRAVYAPQSRGHFGLAKRFYAHFTSPIRRYPDLVVHRQLESLLGAAGSQYAGLAQRGGWAAYKIDSLSSVSNHCSVTEQNADDAERVIIEIKKYRYLQMELAAGKGHPHDAVVVTVTNFGVFVELLDLQIQGLVHISVLSDKYVRFNKAKQSLEAGRQAFKIGSKLKVRVAKVDFDNRRVDFVLAQER